MRLLNILLLLNIFKGKGEYVLGVPKTLQTYYQDSAKKFVCIDKSGVIPRSYVNDDYCDCSDGSDEPGTSACSNGIFCCRNVGYKEKNILSMDVNDKNCDCCDGSDEKPGECPNTCKKLADEEKEEKMRIISILTTAKMKINENTKNLDNLKNNVEQTLPMLAEEIRKLEEIISENKLNEQKLNESLIRAKTSFFEEWENHLHSQYSHEMFQLLDTDSDKMLTNEEFEESEISKIYDVADLEDQLLQHSVSSSQFEKLWPRNPEMIDEDMNYKEVEPEEYEENDDLPKDEYELDDIEYGEDGQIIEKATVGETIETPSPDLPSVTSTPEKSSRNIYSEIALRYRSQQEHPKNDEITDISQNLSRISDKILNLEKDLSALNSKNKHLNSFFSLDFGPEKAYAMLFGVCFSSSFENYNYTICPFFKGTQITTHGTFNLGFWNHWSSDEPQYSKMVYDNGDECYGKLKRSFEISLSCYSENYVKSIEEKKSCHYVIQLLTPAACVSHEIPDIHEDL